MQVSPFLRGVVISARKMQKSVMVGVMHKKHIPKYDKTIVRMGKIMVHDPTEMCDVGDEVVIRSSKPYSKRKRHVVTEILKKDPAAEFLKNNPQFNKIQRKWPTYEQTKPGLEALD
jgi:small subunit ribosomal protein S17